MKTEALEVKSKGESLGSFDYPAPETLEEGLETDGEETVYKLYSMQRKIRWMDAKRRELTGGGLPKTLTEKLKTLDKDKLAQVAALLGIEL